MNKYNIFSFAIVIVLILVIYQLLTVVKIDNTPYIKIAGQNIKVELALTPAEQEKGLSGRSELKEGEGMLFVFNNSDEYVFWMKDMNFAIDMIWLAPFEGGDGEDMRGVYIKKDAQPESFPETYGPDINSKYVLEVVAGFSDKNNLKEGDGVE